MSDNPRIEELRRRLQREPASIAFAQLAEEYRRAGQYQDSVEVCRAGLSNHPAYLSARVTLGRSLLALDRLDEAQEELEHVLTHAPENLTATRCLGEIHEREGALDRALARYQAALDLAPNDPELERKVEDLGQQVGASQGSPGERAPVAEEAPIPSPLHQDAVPAVVEPQYDRLTSGQADVERARAFAMMAALEQWLAAIHVTRAQRHA